MFPSLFAANAGSLALVHWVWTLLLGALMPLFVALVAQTHWSKPMKVFIGVLSCVAAATIQLGLEGQLSGLNIAATAGTIWPLAIIFLKGFWKPLNIADQLEQVTTFLAPKSNGASSGNGLNSSLSQTLPLPDPRALASVVADILEERAVVAVVSQAQKAVQSTETPKNVVPQKSKSERIKEYAGVLGEDLVHAVLKNAVESCAHDSNGGGGA